MMQSEEDKDILDILEMSLDGDLNDRNETPMANGDDNDTLEHSVVVEGPHVEPKTSQESETFWLLVIGALFLWTLRRK